MTPAPPPCLLPLAATLLLFIATSVPLYAQDPPPPLPPAADANLSTADDDSDAPDITNRTHAVDDGLIQIEFGGAYSRSSHVAHDLGTPLAVRFGLTDSLEINVSDDGLMVAAVGDARASGVGNLQVGAKLEVLSDEGNRPGISLIPAIIFPAPGGDRGLGTSLAGATIAVVGGTDFLDIAHADLTYGIGRIGSSDGTTRFTQHVAMVETSLEIPGPITPALNVSWASKADAGSGPLAVVELAAVYQINERYAVDAGVQQGLTRDTPDFAVQCGLSVVVGDIPHGDGVHARQSRTPGRRRGRGAKNRH